MIANTINKDTIMQILNKEYGKLNIATNKKVSKEIESKDISISEKARFAEVRFEKIKSRNVIVFMGSRTMNKEQRSEKQMSVYY